MIIARFLFIFSSALQYFLKLSVQYNHLPWASGPFQKYKQNKRSSWIYVHYYCRFVLLWAVRSLGGGLKFWKWEYCGWIMGGRWVVRRAGAVRAPHNRGGGILLAPLRRRGWMQWRLAVLKINKIEIHCWQTWRKI